MERFKIIKKPIPIPKREGLFAWLFTEVITEYETKVICVCGAEFEYHTSGRFGTLDSGALVELLNHLDCDKRGK